MTPDSIKVQSISTAGTVTLVSNGTITEGGSDAAADIVAGELILSAQGGVGSGANAIETQVSALEAETVTGGITLSNFGSVQIGGITDEVDGLDVATSGNLRFTNAGSILLADETGAETVHGGSTSGSVSLTANGFDADIIGHDRQRRDQRAGGNITLQAGRDVGFGIIGTDFDNDVRARSSVTINAGRDFLIDGFADLPSDDFGAGTGGSLRVHRGPQHPRAQHRRHRARASPHRAARVGMRSSPPVRAARSRRSMGPARFALGSTFGRRPRQRRPCADRRKLGHQRAVGPGHYPAGFAGGGRCSWEAPSDAAFGDRAVRHRDRPHLRHRR